MSLGGAGSGHGFSWHYSFLSVSRVVFNWSTVSVRRLAKPCKLRSSRLEQVRNTANRSLPSRSCRLFSM